MSFFFFFFVSSEEDLGIGGQDIRLSLILLIKERTNNFLYSPPSGEGDYGVKSETGFYPEVDEYWGFSGGAVVKNPPANAGDVGSIPGSGRSPVRRAWQPSPVSLPGEFRGHRSLVGYSP